MPRIDLRVPATHPDHLRAAVIATEALVGKLPDNHPLVLARSAALSVIAFKDNLVDWPLETFADRMEDTVVPAILLNRFAWSLGQYRADDIKSELRTLSDPAGFHHTELTLYIGACLMAANPGLVVSGVAPQRGVRTPDLFVPSLNVAIECKARTLRRPDGPLIDDFDNASKKFEPFEKSHPECTNILVVDLGLCSHPTRMDVGRPVGDGPGVLREALGLFDTHPLVHGFVFSALSLPHDREADQMRPMTVLEVVFRKGVLPFTEFDRAFGLREH